MHKSPWRAALALIALAVLPGMLGGCAKRPPASDPEALADYQAANDPLEPTNRFFYGVFKTVDSYTLKPVAQAYVYVVPQPVRAGVHHLLGNIAEPVTFFNAILEAKPRRAGDTLVRFTVNSTVGLAGIFDVAGELGYPEPESGGALTLAYWGLPSGPYLFLPLLGPGTVRSFTGYALDIGLSPLTYVPRGYGLLTLNYATYGLGIIDARSLVLHDFDELQNTSLDPYATIRSGYQQREASQLQHLRDDHRSTPPDWYAR
jgi:phospholipid-binding lipoprotein MlaA